jgi:amino acid transporter
MSDKPAGGSIPRPGLIRALGPVMGTALVAGTIIGSGIFKKPQAVAVDVPYFGPALLAWVLGGVLAVLGALAYAEVASLLPKAGGNYVFLREGFGRLAGFLWGWVEFWIIRAGSWAALATIFTESLHDVLRLTVSTNGEELLGFWTQRFFTIAVIAVLAAVNIRGVVWGGAVQVAVTAVKVFSLTAIMLLPFVAFAIVTGAPAANFDGLKPVWPADWSTFSWSGFGAALVGILFAYHGWMNIAPVAEEVENPQRNIPLSLFLGVGIIIVLYCGAAFAYELVIPHTEISQVKGTTVAAAFALRLLGPIGSAAAAAAVMFSTFGALNGNLLAGPRLLYAMGEDGLAPKRLAEVHATFRTPVPAIIVMSLWTSVLVLAGAALTQWRLPTFEIAGRVLDLNLPANKPLFDVLTDFAMFGAIAFETLAVASIFVFRRTMPDAERPYVCWGYPAVPIVYIALMTPVLVNMFVRQTTEAMIGVGFVAVGAAVYVFFLPKSRPPVGDTVTG